MVTDVDATTHSVRSPEVVIVDVTETTATVVRAVRERGTAVIICSLSMVEFGPAAHFIESYHDLDCATIERVLAVPMPLYKERARVVPAYIRDIGLGAWHRALVPLTRRIIMTGDKRRWSRKRELRKIRARL